MGLQHPLTGSTGGRKSRGGTFVLAAAIVVLLAGVVQLVAGAASVGVTVDEPVHVLRMQGWIGEGWYVPPTLLADGDPRPIPEASPYVYGPAYSAVAHAANMVLGNESSGEVSVTKAAWETRHMVVALIGLLTAAAVGLAVWLLTASRRFALWGAAALLAFPIWLGMSFFNPKDIPAAAGYTLFTVGLVVALGRGRRIRSSWRSAVAVAALLAVGIFLGAGTRLALWAALLASAGTFGVLVWGTRRFGGAGRDRLGTGAVLVGILVGILAVGVSYPAVFSNPFDLLTQSITDSSDFPWTGMTLTGGHLLSQNPPWWYLPAWTFASSPVLLLLFAVIGGIGFLSAVATARRRIDSNRLRTWFGRDDLAMVLVIQQALLLPVGSVLIGASMYSGLRQHLYVVPALAILAGVGACSVWRRVVRSPWNHRWRRRVAAVVISAALVLPMVEQTLLFPYNYVYVNPVAGIGGINGRWETDFWWASSREALSKLPESAVPFCGSFDRPPANGAPTITECVFRFPIAPYLDERQGVPIEGSRPAADSIWVLSRIRALSVPPAQCRQERNVTRWLRGEDVLMSYVLTCDSSLAQESTAPP